MARLFLHLLLMFGLVLNGVSPAWAHVHADASHPGAHAAMSVATSALPDVEARASTMHRDHAQHMHHAAGSHAATTDALAPALDDDATTQHDCCDKASCQCGCILPPAVARDATLLAAPQRAPAQRCSVTPLALVRASSPPFRPPAA